MKVLRFRQPPRSELEHRIDLLRESLANVAKMHANGVPDAITLGMCEVIQGRLDALERGAN